MIWSKISIILRRGNNDTRETPAIRICQALLEEGARLAIHDPQVDSETIATDLGCASTEADGGWQCCSDVAAAGADALIILTEWDQYASLDWAALAQVMRHPAWLFDTRGLADLEAATAAGLRVWRVGLGDPSLVLAP